MAQTDPVLFRQLGLPVFQNKVYATRQHALAATCGDVELVQSPSTGLVHNRLFDPGLLVYDGEYQNEQAHSATFQGHLDRVLNTVMRHITDPTSVVEIGCGKGRFLERLWGAGVDAIGFDAAYEGTHPRIRNHYFGASPMEASPGFVVLRHVLEHIDAPWHFLQAIRSHCRPDARIYIEVPCFDWIVSRRAFYDIFYEHVNYFTLDLLEQAFGDVVESGHLFGGQYLHLVANLGSFRPPLAAGRAHDPLDMEAYLRELLARRKRQRAFIWGAGAKGITFANLAVRAGARISGLIDINPRKQDRFAGGCGLPIISPASARPSLAGADVFVMNPCYRAEIEAEMTGLDVNFIEVAS